MQERIWSGLARRVAIAIVTAVTVAALAGGAYVVASHAPASPPGLDNKPDVATEPAGADSAGGTVERFHGDGDHACALPEGSTLEGNWTHGSYVSAWAGTGDHDALTTAVESGCGLPQDAWDARNAEHGASAETHGQSGAEHGQSGEEHGKPAEPGPPGGDGEGETE